MNPAAERILGKPAEEFLGQTSVDQEPHTFHEDGRPFPGTEHPSMVALATGREVRNVVMKVYNPREQGYRWIEVTAVPLVRPGTAKPYQVYTIFDDITGRKKTAEALRDSEGFASRVLTASLNGIYIYDLKTGLNTFINPQYTALTGYTLDHLNRMTAAEFFSNFHPEDQPLIAAHMGALRHAADGEIIEAEYRFRRADGRWMWCTSRDAVFSREDGAVRQFIGSFLDITERKTSEERLAGLSQRLEAHFQNTPVMVVEYSPDFTVTRWSPECERVFGWQAEEVVGKNLSQLRWVYDEDMPAIRRIVARMLDGRARRSISFNRNYRKDGSVAWCEWYNSTVCDANGGLESVLCFGLDVTERRRTERELAQSQNRLALALDAAELGTWEVDVASGAVTASARTCAMFDFETAHPRIEDWLARLHPDDVERVRSELAGAMASRSKYDTEYRTIGRDGSTNWVLAKAAMTPDAQGRPALLIGVAQDITERKRAEQKLIEATRNAEARAAETEEGKRILDGLMEHIPEGITIASAPDVVTIRTSKHGINLLAQGWQTTEGLSMEDWLAKVEHYLPDGVTPARTEDLPLWKAVKRGETVEGQELILRRPSGDRLPVLCNAGPIRDRDGRITGGIVAWRDITDRKRDEAAFRESESRYRSLVDLSPDAVLVHQDCRILYCNAAAVRLYAAQGPEQLLGKDPVDLVHPDHAETARARIRTVLAGGTSPVRELRHIRLDGQEVAVEATAGQVAWNGRPAVQVIIRDITARRHAEERLRQAQKLESLGLLAGGVAHDFNNLLVGVIGNASLIQDMLPRGSAENEIVERIIKTGEQAAHLTRQMLAYSGKGRFVVEPLDLSELIAETNELVQPSISRKISVHLDLQRDLPHTEADRSQIQQVFMNLAINAAEAIGAGSGLISIKTGVQILAEPYIAEEFGGAPLAPGVYVYLEVRDNGCGMDDATRFRIFDPFFSTKFTGRGLGLAAVAGIVRGHGGAISVASAPGKGTCFTVLFPATERVAVAGGAAAPGSDIRGSGTVLVVDDEEIVRDMAKTSLERHGFKVLVAESGPASVDMFKRYPGDISMVVLDLSMPGMSGEETLRELRKIRPGVRVMISSGYSETEAMRLFHGQRVSGFIQKPYTSARLAERVKSAIE